MLSSSSLARIAVLVLFALTAAGCELAGGIFKGGIWVGAIGVIVVVLLLVVIVGKFKR